MSENFPRGWENLNAMDDPDEPKQYPEVVLGPAAIPAPLRRWTVPTFEDNNMLMSRDKQHMLSTIEQAEKRRAAFEELETLKVKLDPILKEWGKSRAAIAGAEQVLGRLEASENVKDVPGIVENRVRLEVLKRRGATIDQEKSYLSGSIARLEAIVADDYVRWARFGEQRITEMIERLEAALAERRAVLAWKRDELTKGPRKGAPTIAQARWDLEPPEARARRRPGSKTNGEATPEGVVLPDLIED